MEASRVEQLVERDPIGESMNFKYIFVLAAFIFFVAFLTSYGEDISALWLTLLVFTFLMYATGIGKVRGELRALHLWKMPEQGEGHEISFNFRGPKTMKVTAEIFLGIFSAMICMIGFLIGNNVMVIVSIITIVACLIFFYRYRFRAKLRGGGMYNVFEDAEEGGRDQVRSMTQQGRV